MADANKSDHKLLRAFMADRTIRQDTTAYVRQDCVFSDRFRWMTPYLNPARRWRWNGRDRAPSVNGMAYILRQAQPYTEYMPEVLERLTKVYEDATEGRHVKKKGAADNFRMQVMLVVGGILGNIFIFGAWIFLSITAPIPDYPPDLVDPPPVVQEASTPAAGAEIAPEEATNGPDVTDAVQPQGQVHTPGP